MARRPSFVVFITDQHRADWLGCMGHPVLRTPNIDAIADQGTLFRRFHVASPVCMPNRASLLTGRYPSQHGLRYNGCVLPLRANTFVDVLAAGGYRTAAIGKSHVQPMLDTPPLRPDPPRAGPVAEAWATEPGDVGQERPGRYAEEGRAPFQTPYYGYQHVDMVTGHGDRCGGHYGQWFRQMAPGWRALHDPANEVPHNYTCPQAYRTPVPEDLYPTAYVRDRAIDYLAAQRGEGAPFFLFVSFPDPHHPFNPPGRYWDLYDPDDFEVRLPYAAHRNPPPPLRWLYECWQSGSGQATAQTAFMTEEDNIRQAMALTAGMMAMIDDAVGAVMAALKESGRYEETVVCVTSDHGDYLGDFSMLLKGALQFKSITRVPFLWSDPDNRRAAETGALGSTVDLAATVLDRAGLAPYNGMAGRSLMDALDGGAGPNGDLLIEYNDGGPRLGFAAPARVRSLVTQDHRFSVYRDQDWGELYDLSADPDETHNLWDAPEAAAMKAQLSLRLNHRLTGLMDESPLSERLA